MASFPPSQDLMLDKEVWLEGSRKGKVSSTNQASAQWASVTVESMTG